MKNVIKIFVAISFLFAILALLISVLNLLEVPEETIEPIVVATATETDSVATETDTEPIKAMVEPPIVKEVVLKARETTIEQPSDVSDIYVGKFELTAYIATGNPCADGVYPSVGYTVACNDKRLWHKKVYIEGYGTYFVHDTGGMSSNVIDIFMGSYDEAIQFGRRLANVYIVEE